MWVAVRPSVEDQLVEQSMAGQLELYTDKKGGFRSRLVASNGQTILSSEG